MKKILLLGGSAQQIVAIETAKKNGLYTVLCDYLPDNPGQYVADKFYLVSTTDKEKILEVARKENISGVLAYASDPAAPTAAYVAEKLRLPGNPYESVEILCNKDRFRRFLNNNNFATPLARGYEFENQAYSDLKRRVFDLPVIIKPVDSSGSKGITIVNSLENARMAIEFAFSFSRNHRIVIEEYIEKKHPYLIGGDVFVVDGKIVLWGLLNCHRDERVNKLVPVGKSFPLQLDDSDIENVKNTIQMLVDKLAIKFGAMNVELLVDKNNRVYLIDIGPRSGGNLIPDLLGMIFGVDIVEWSIKMAMGLEIDVSTKCEEVYYATHNLHACKNGYLSQIRFSPELEKYIIRKFIYKKQGDKIEYFDNASKALGVIFLKFPNEKEMKVILENIVDEIQIVYQ